MVSKDRKFLIHDGLEEIRSVLKKHQTGYPSQVMFTMILRLRCVKETHAHLDQSSIIVIKVFTNLRTPHKLLRLCFLRLGASSHYLNQMVVFT